MKITRIINKQEVTIELTNDELSEAHKEFIMNFMRNEFETIFGRNSKDAKELAEIAYEKYEAGDGLTEYECIEYALDKDADER